MKEDCIHYFPNSDSFCSLNYGQCKGCKFYNPLFEPSELTLRKIYFKEEVFTGVNAELNALHWISEHAASPIACKYAADNKLILGYTSETQVTENGVVGRFWLVFHITCKILNSPDSLEVGEFVQGTLVDINNRFRNSSYDYTFKNAEPFSYMWQCTEKSLKNVNGSEFCLADRDTGTEFSHDLNHLLMCALNNNSKAKYYLKDGNREIAYIDRSPVNHQRRVFVNLEYEYLFSYKEDYELHILP